MPVLVLLHTDSNIASVEKVLNSGIFDKIVLFTRDDVENVTDRDDITKVYLSSTSIDAMQDEMSSLLKDYFHDNKIQELDIAINISSGNGKEHAALISSILKLGHGIRFIEIDKDDDVVEL